jgi:hypothetical protein
MYSNFSKVNDIFYGIFFAIPKKSCTFAKEILMFFELGKR